MMSAKRLKKILGVATMVMAGVFFQTGGGQGGQAIKLPAPAHKGGMALNEALQVRRTMRQFANRPLDLAQVSQLMWGADGLSDPRGYRTAPSAGATFPVDVYLVVGERGAGDLAAGVYLYQVREHALELTAPGDVRAAVARASLSQTWMAQAPVMVVIAADFRRCTARYRDRGYMYTHMEAGNISQNVMLMAEALGLGAGIVGAFEDRNLAQTLSLPANTAPLLVLPVGYKY
jgi:SagB-type dehydrogenase family enzyme